jgi:hypothetical protein
MIERDHRGRGQQHRAHHAAQQWRQRLALRMARDHRVGSGREPARQHPGPGDDHHRPGQPLAERERVRFELPPQRIEPRHRAPTERLLFRPQERAGVGVRGRATHRRAPGSMSGDSAPSGGARVGNSPGRVIFREFEADAAA